MPGILTGTIIGLAQAAGETAPLLMIFDRIVAVIAKSAKQKRAIEKLFARGETSKNFAKSSKKLSWFSVSDEKQNRNGHIP